MHERLALPPGRSVTLAEVAGQGVVTHLFLALGSEDIAGRASSLVKIYVDGESAPSIVTDVDGLFGAFGGATFKTRYIGSDGLHNATLAVGGYIYFDIPFGTALRVELENGSTTSTGTVWSILSYALGGTYDWGRYGRLRNVNFATTGNMLRIASYAEEVLADIAGRGALFAVMFFLECEAPYWRPLEGNFRFYVDGETTPSWESSGTEDYFGGSFYFNGGPFAAEYLGAPLIDHANRRLVGYRFHVPDPIVFDRSLKVTWMNGEPDGGALSADSLIAGNVWYYTDH